MTLVLPLKVAVVPDWDHYTIDFCNISDKTDRVQERPLKIQCLKNENTGQEGADVCAQMYKVVTEKLEELDRMNKMLMNPTGYS